MISDPIGDLFTRIRNGYMAGKKKVSVPYSQNKEAIVKVLTAKKIIDSFKVVSEGFKKTIVLTLVSGSRRLLQIKRVSKPGCRIYLNSKKLYSYKGQQGFLLVSTSKGIMDGLDAQKLKVGGEILAEIF